MKTLLVVFSYHHHNTEKVAEVMAKVLGAKIVTPSEVDLAELEKCDLVGFGSGIYDDKHHVSLLSLVDKLPEGKGKKTFIFSTSGVPVGILGDKFLRDYMPKAHAALKNKLESKGYEVLDNFICPGFNTNVFLKYFGGLNKDRPNEVDLEKARDFVKKLKTEQ